MVRDEAQAFASRSPERQLMVRLDPGDQGHALLWLARIAIPSTMGHSMS